MTDQSVEGRGSSDLLDQIVAKGSRPREIIAVEAWGGAKIEVRGLSVTERTSLYDGMKVTDGESIGRDELAILFPRLFHLSCFEPGTDNRVFPEDCAAILEELATNGVDQVADVALRASGMRESVDDLGKASTSAPDSDTSSG